MAQMSDREFTDDVRAAKRQATDGPLIITDQGEPAFVLLSFEDYRRLQEPGLDLLNRLSMDDDDELFNVEPAHLELKIPEL